MNPEHAGYLTQLIIAKERNITIILFLCFAVIMAGSFYVLNRDLVAKMDRPVNTAKVESKIDDSALFLKSVVETNGTSTVFEIEDILGKKLGEERAAMKQAISALHCPKCKVGDKPSTPIAKVQKPSHIRAKNAKKPRQHKGQRRKTPPIAKKAAKDELDGVTLEPFVTEPKPVPKESGDWEYQGTDKDGTKLYINRKSGIMEFR
jgi:hypothetical protein